MSEINLEEIQHKLYEKLKLSGWGDKLKVFLLSQEFRKILQTLYDESQAGQKFTPMLKHLFRAFEECPYGELKVLFLGQDPYPYVNTADGMAFSCSITGKPQPSLRYMFKEIEDTVYRLEGYTWDPDLTRWAKQGVLLLNTALTTTVNQVGTHYIMWRPFIGFLLDILSAYNPGLIYVFLGKKAGEWARSIPDNNYKIFTIHPAAAAHSNSESWDSQDMFNKVNQILMKNNGLKIIW